MTRLHDDAERRLGRKLTAGERNIELVRNVSALEQGKAELRLAIEREKSRAIRAFVRRGETPRLQVTPAMRAALRRTFVAGREAAVAETEAVLGERPAARKLATDEPKLEGAIATLRRHLAGISYRVEREGVDEGVGVGLDLTSAAEAALERALERQIPGALDAASRLVSGAFGSGLADGFEPSLNDFGGWTYSAIMDAATCEVCEGYDGDFYDTWDAIQDVLPDGGPNPACDGEGRCRCRPVPEPAL